MDPTLPIIIADGDDIMAYRTLADAALALEGPDVIAGTYQAFDARGRPLALGSTGGPHDYSARVTIALADAAPQPERLAELLQRTLAAVGLAVPPTASLDYLLSAFLARHGYGR